jgi:pimeloyl-ACP methyl ester carboxylesterase
LDHWEEYVDWVYQKMLSNPTIDPAQVYLWGASAETEHLSNLAQKYPDRWKGLILINPAMLPDLPTLAASPSPPKIFYSQGALEGTNSAVQYQLEAAKNGIQVEFYAHEREAHWVFGKRALGERAEKMMQFIFQN